MFYSFLWYVPYCLSGNISRSEGCSATVSGAPGRQPDPIYQALWADTIDFNEMLISPVMVHDHMPDTVLLALNKVCHHPGFSCLVLCYVKSYSLARFLLALSSISMPSFFSLLLCCFDQFCCWWLIGAEAREAACRVSEANRRPLFHQHLERDTVGCVRIFIFHFHK